MGWFDMRAVFWDRVLRLAVWVAALALVGAVVHLSFVFGKAQGSLDCWTADGGRR